MITENFNTYTFKFLSGVKNKMTEFTEEPDLIVYESIGLATAGSVEHAIILALQHKEGFLKEAVGYRVRENNDIIKILSKATGKDYVGVEFYKLKRKNQEELSGIGKFFADNLNKNVLEDQKKMKN